MAVTAASPAGEAATLRASAGSNPTHAASSNTRAETLHPGAFFR